MQQKVIIWQFHSGNVELAFLLGKLRPHSTRAQCPAYLYQLARYLLHTVAGRVNPFPSACRRHPCPLIGKSPHSNKATNSWVPETLQHNRDRPIQSTPQSQVHSRLGWPSLNLPPRDPKKGERAHVSSLVAPKILQGVVLDVMAFPGAVDSLGVFCTTTCALSLWYLSFY